MKDHSSGGSWYAASSTSTPSSAWTPPARTTSPTGITAEALCDAIDLAAAAAAVVIEHQDQAVRLGFGAQTDTRIIRHGTDLPGTGQALDGVAVLDSLHRQVRAKTLSAPGVPSQRLRGDADIERCAARRTTGG